MNFTNNIEIFSSRDKIRDQIIELAKAQLSLENFDFNKSSYLSYFINVLSILAADSIYHNSAVWRQFFLLTADQRESVLNLSAMLGYESDFATPALADILVTIPLNYMTSGGTYSFTMFGKTDSSLEKPFKYKAGDIIFSQLNTLNISIVYIEETGGYNATIKENYTFGDLTNFNLSYNLLPYQIIDISTGKALRFLTRAIQVEQYDDEGKSFNIQYLKPYEFLVKDLDYKDGQVSDISILTTNQELKDSLSTSRVSSEAILPTLWIKFASVPLIPNTVYGYVLRQTTRGSRVFFGNGIYGRQPKEGDLCTIILNLTYGSKGNVIPGSIIECDEISFSVGESRYKKIKPQVINPSPAYGGEDAPTIDEIRNNAITHVKSNERLVTSDDYDSFRSVCGNLPINDVKHVLKRSDLKRNEICIFTDLIYNDTVNTQSYITPTRNTLWIFDTTGGTQLTLRRGSTISIDGVNYISMFNIDIDPEYLDSRYYYIADDLQVPVAISRATVTDSNLVPTYCTFYLDEGDTPSGDKIRFDLLYNKIITGDLPDMVCNVTLPWNGRSLSMAHSEADSKFYLDSEDYIDVSEIPTGSQSFKFEITNVSNSSSHVIENISIVNATISQDLSEFMYSQVRTYTDTTALDDFLIYDVPVVLEDFYDRIDQSKFNYYTLSKIVNFDVTKHIMITDFANFKFANTIGYCRNMLLNEKTKDAVDEINPCSLPVYPTHGSRYAVSNNDNPWDRNGGFVAIASDYTPSGWLFEALTINDTFYDNNTEHTLVYNGENFVRPIHGLPINIDLIVWMSTQYTGTDSGLIDKIKTALINEFYPSFGFDSNILISDIIKVVKSVDGVSNCKVINPNHDIIYNFKLEELTESELLTYTPSLTYFDSTTISIEVRI